MGWIPRRPLSPSGRMCEFSLVGSLSSPLCVGRVSFGGDLVARVGSAFFSGTVFWVVESAIVMSIATRAGVLSGRDVESLVGELLDLFSRPF